MTLIIITKYKGPFFTIIDEIITLIEFLKLLRTELTAIVFTAEDWNMN